MDGAESATGERPADPRLVRLLKDAQKQLLETGTRNRLVHVNRDAARANVINIVNERSEEVFRLLVTDRRTMSFVATGQDRKDDEEEDTPSLATVSSDAAVDEGRYADLKLETRLGPDGLQKRLLKIARDATTSEQEQGVNILFLALGFLKWFEDENSSVAREAPLILLPVAFKRNARTSAYDIEFREDEVVTNLSLQERLKGDFGIVLPELPDVSELSPAAYFHAVREAVSTKQRWSVDDDAMQLGFFSFAKLLMHRDLDPANWPEGGLLGQDLLGGLLIEGFESEPAMFADDANLDAIFKPDDLIQVVDADSSQTKVIEEVRTGRNLVVQGPPGTGKSQTITNIIAAAVHDGKRVLFVAEKMAALSVVHKRLVESDLRDVCLELHSKNANKKHVLDEIGRTLQGGRAVPDSPAAPNRLTEVRDNLNRLSGMLHQPLGDTGQSPFDALAYQSRMMSLGAPTPSTHIDRIGELGAEQISRMLAAVRRFGESRARYGASADHPFYGLGHLDLQPLELQRHKERLAKIAAALKSLGSNLSKIRIALGVDAPDTADAIPQVAAILDCAMSLPPIDPDIAIQLLGLQQPDTVAEALRAGRDWRDARGSREALFAQTAWAADLSPLRGPVAAGRLSFFARLGGSYRNASRQLAGYLAGELPKAAADRLSLIDGLLDVAARRRALADVEPMLRQQLGAAWLGERTDFEVLGKVVEWCARVRSVGVRIDHAKLVQAASKREWLQSAHKALSNAPAVISARDAIAHELKLDTSRAFGGPADRIPLEALALKFGGMADATERYGEWVELSKSETVIREGGAPHLADRMMSGDLDGESAEREVRLCRAEAIWTRAISERPGLGKLDAGARAAMVDEFQALERSRFADTSRTIKSRHLQQLPQGAVGVMGIVRGELGKQRKHKPIRKLMEEAGEAIQRIKPVFLMSPLSVAQFLKPGKLTFDLLVIDEASQVRPEDALGAIARARQIVVVGDRKQLPPTSFFDRMTAGDDDTEEEETEQPVVAAKATELESILTLCEARGLPSRMLEWHYRSRDPSLIAVSNDEFYGSRLVLPPSPLQDDPAFGLTLRRVNGVYDRGKKRNNRIEGEAIVRAVAEHARLTPHLSLGVATFSTAQRDLIDELLEHARRTDRTLDAFLREGQAEDFFVKNLENVQGDERDVILVSVGYGPDMSGQGLRSMSFGPVNLEGGARRLNVLFTRAKLRCEIIVSFDPADISLDRSRADGVRVLKRYLEFAQTGILDERRPTGEGADSPFEEMVADEIRALGFEVDHQVGSSGFRIDLGVRHSSKPGRYLLAVECDGATYHSALWARERDRQRQQILEHLGWRFHRIWSTDWFYRRSDEIARLKQALEDAKTAAEAARPPPGANVQRPAPRPTPRADEASIVVPAPVYQATPYRRWSGTVSSSLEPHEVAPERLAPVVIKIVEAEGPIHQEEVGRRVALAFGKDRAGSRIADVSLRALQAARRAAGVSIRERNGFWFTTAQEASPPVRDRSAETMTVLKAEYLPPIEIAAAIRQILKDSHQVPEDELIVAVSRLLGFKRTGPDIAGVMRAVLAELVEARTVALQDGMFKLPDEGLASI
jgi:very-short-patch-repair endonuclease